MITGSHLPVITHGEYPGDYFNRKGQHSLVQQAVMLRSGQEILWDMCFGYLWSIQDSRILRQSSLWDILGDGYLFSKHKVNMSGCDVGTITG